MASIYEVFFRREQAPALHLHGNRAVAQAHNENPEGQMTFR